MSLLLIVQAIVAFLKFPEEMRRFLLLLEKTPEEKRAEIAQRINKELEDVLNGAPIKWD